jgi:putative aldouronate transport system substrate-binding protein
MKKLIMAFAALAVIMSLFACKKKTGDVSGGKQAGPAEITVEVFDRGTDGGKSDPTNNNWTAWIKEKILKDENIKVTFIPISRWDENTALNNLMSAGNPPDVCISYSGELITNYSELGGLFDMAPYTKTTLKDLNAFLGKDEALPGRDFIERNKNPENGKIYSIPARRINTARLNLFIRKDWLDKLGLPIPKTPQEYYDALVAFKEKDPGKVGKVIPFTMTPDVRWTAGAILEGFIDPNLSLKERWVNTVIDRYFLVKGYKDGFAFLNKMYNAGLVDRDFPLYKSDDDMFNVVKTGAVGSVCHNWDQIYRESVGVLTDLQKNIPGAEFVPIDAMRSSDGVTHKISYDAAGVNYFIPASCKNTDAAMRYLNWLARFENYNFLQIGPAGIVHDAVDGIPKIKNATGLWIQNSAQNIDYTPMINGLDLGSPELNAKALATGYPWPAEAITNAYTIAMTNAKPGPVIPVALTAAGPVFQTLVDKTVILSSAGVTAKLENFNEVWDKGIQDLLDSGAQIVIDERRAKYIEP